MSVIYPPPIWVWALRLIIDLPSWAYTMDYSLFVEFLDLESSWFAMVSLHPPWLWGGESKHHVHVTGQSSIHLQQYKIQRTCILVAETSNSWVDLINPFRGFLPYFTCDKILNFQIIPPSGSYVAGKASISLLSQLKGGVVGESTGTFQWLAKHPR